MERFDLFMIESIFLSFDHIKQSIWLKNRWSNSKPEKSEREHITLDYFKKRAASVIRLWLEQIALKKRAIFSQKTIDSIEKTDDRIPNPAKEQLWANQSRFLLKRAVSVIRANHYKKTSNLFKRSVFLCFWQFFTIFPSFYAQEQIAPVTVRSIELFKERQEWFALVAL